jgi:hypothetical protein
MKTQSTSLEPQGLDSGELTKDGEFTISPLVRGISLFCAMDLVYSSDFVPSASPAWKVECLFDTCSGNYLAVTQQQRVVGLLERRGFFKRMALDSSRALFSEEAVRFLMDRNPLVVEAKMDPFEVFTQAKSRLPETVDDDIVVTQDGFYVGLISMQPLMEFFAEESRRVPSFHLCFRKALYE